ncbi:hypothetical protein IJ182_10755 [bacterium]|nr:hypothetical protein [bacterium]
MDIFYVYIAENSSNPKISHSLQHEIGRKIIEYVAKNLYKINNSEIEIINNKPQFKYSSKQFSISHSKNIVMVAFDDFPVGLDVEFIKPRDYNSLAKRMNFVLDEDNINCFYKRWTQYEAEYKLGCKPFSIDSRLFIDTYMLSVCSSVKNNIGENIHIQQLIESIM